MDPARLIRTARLRAELSLRKLAVRADTSHSALAAYESGRTVPNVDTLNRIVRGAGFALDVELRPHVEHFPESADRGQELIDVLELAGMFPARHEPTLTYPRFGGTAA